MPNLMGELFRGGAEINQVYGERDVGVRQKPPRDAKFPTKYKGRSSLGCSSNSLLILVVPPLGIYEIVLSTAFYKFLGYSEAHHVGARHSPEGRAP